MQYGFCSGRSCEQQLLRVVNSGLIVLIDAGTNIDILYLDLQKAFDKVPHKCLIHKLEAYGVAGDALGWIINFLGGHRQRVCVRGSASSWSPTISGVPQGSVLGPILFIIYMNDLPDGLKSSLWEFSDGNKLYRCIESPTDWSAL